jgi:hypothetical protein
MFNMLIGRYVHRNVMNTRTRQAGVQVSGWATRAAARCDQPFALSTSLNTSVAILNASRQAGMPQ